jgi:hypothetical protein
MVKQILFSIDKNQFVAEKTKTPTAELRPTDKIIRWP